MYFIKNKILYNEKNNTIIITGKLQLNLFSCIFIINKDVIKGDKCENITINTTRSD